MAIDTSKLSGYAKAYAEALNAGTDDVAAHAAATKATGSGGSGSGYTFTAFDPSGSGAATYAVDPTGAYKSVSKSSTTKKSSSNKIDTTGLSGYALAYANALNGGASDAQATAAATTKSGSLQDLLPASVQPQYQDNYQQVRDMIADIQKNQIKPPVYQEPDYSSILPATPGVAATANRADTTFVPTSRYQDRVQQEKQAIDAQSYNAYNANLGTYNAAQTAQQQQLSNLMSLLPYSTLTAAQQADQELSLLPYSTMTAAQQAELEANKANSTLQAQIDAQKMAEQQRQFDLTYDLQKRETDYATSKPYYNPNTGGGGGSSSGTQTERANTAFGEEAAGMDQWLQNNLPSGSNYTVANVNSQLTQAEAFIWQNGAYYKSRGIDPADLVDYVYQKVTGKPKAKPDDI